MNKRPFSRAIHSQEPTGWSMSISMVSWDELRQNDVLLLHYCDGKRPGLFDKSISRSFRDDDRLFV